MSDHKGGKGKEKKASFFSGAEGKGLPRIEALFQTAVERGGEGSPLHGRTRATEQQQKSASRKEDSKP